MQRGREGLELEREGGREVQSGREGQGGRDWVRYGATSGEQLLSKLYHGVTV